MVSQARKIVGDSGGGRAENDFYPTPVEATLALLHKETFKPPIVWECACGKGDISKVLLSMNYDVISTDKFEYGYSKNKLMDFLTTKKLYAANIVTNPPYRLANDFVLHALRDLKVEKLALLLKLAFLEGQERYDKIFMLFPPVRVHVFSKRLSMTRYGEKPTSSGMIAFAWFVWEKDFRGNPRLDWIQ